MRRALLIVLTTALFGFFPPKLQRPVRTALVRVTDAGQLYSTINTIDCLAWPSDDVRTASGMGAWAGWAPVLGDIGVPVGRSKHCFQPDVMVVIIRFGTRYAPLNTKGLAFDVGTVEDVPLLTK